LPSNIREHEPRSLRKRHISASWPTCHRRPGRRAQAAPQGSIESRRTSVEHAISRYEAATMAGTSGCHRQERPVALRAIMPRRRADSLHIKDSRPNLRLLGRQGQPFTVPSSGFKAFTMYKALLVLFACIIAQVAAHAVVTTPTPRTVSFRLDNR
jgi:hypothetical protein